MKNIISGTAAAEKETQNNNVEEKRQVDVESKELEKDSKQNNKDGEKNEEVYDIPAGKLIWPVLILIP